jgi:hypothetical protein
MHSTCKMISIVRDKIRDAFITCTGVSNKKKWRVTKRQVTKRQVQNSKLNRPLYSYAPIHKVLQKLIKKVVTSMGQEAKSTGK